MKESKRLWQNTDKTKSDSYTPSLSIFIIQPTGKCEKRKKAKKQEKKINE